MGKFKQIDITIQEIKTVAILFLAITLVLSTFTILLIDKENKRIAKEYQKANTTTSYWIQQYKIVEKEYRDVLKVNESLNFELGTFQRQINNVDTRN